MANASSRSPAAGTNPREKRISVVFVNLFAPQRYLTFGLPLSLEVLTGDLRGEYPGQVEVTILDMQTGLSADDVVRRIRQLNPDVLGITIKVTERKLAEKILDPVLAADFPREKRPRYIIVGGHRPRFFNEEFLSKYDDVLICTSEGELTMRGLVDLIQGRISSLREIPNLIFKEGEEVVRTPIKVLDLQHYHLPSLETLDFIEKKHGMIYSESSRGCGWAKCTFCSRQFARGTTLRAIPTDVVVSNLERLYQRGARIVYFTDEDFLLYNPDRIMAISTALIERNIQLSFWIQTRADNLYSPSATPQENEKKLEAVRLFHKAGLQRILFGVESGSPSQARRYNKGIDLNSIARATKIAKDVGLQVETGFIPIDPYVTLGELQESLKFMEANELQDSIVRVLNIVCLSEGAALFKKIARDGLVCGERDPDSLLISYKMYDPGMEYLRETAQNWLNETLSFIYALRRVVDASPQGVIEEKYLIHFRRLDFVFLKGLVRLLAAKSIEAEDIDDLSQWLANLGSPTEEILEMATDLGSAVGKELTELLRRQFVARFIRALRVHRDALVLSLESAITAGLIADGEGFLLQGIAEIKSIEGTRSRLAFLRDTARENARRKQLRQFAEQAERTAVHSEARSA
ncbi:MAG: radical SAM protein [Thermoguttaceae bacterium]